MDTTKLRMGEAIAGGSAILLLVFMFLPWYGYSVPGGRETVSRNAWEAYALIDIVLFVAVLAAVALVLLAMTQQSVALPISLSVFVTLLGGLATVLIVFRILVKPGLCAGGLCAHGLDKNLKIGVFLGLLSAAGVTAGGFLAMQEEGTSLADAAERLQGGQSGAPPPPPAPTGGPPPPA